MRRALVGVALILPLAGLVCMAASVALLSELVPWPMMLSAVPMTEVPLEPTPLEDITHLPALLPDVPALAFGLLTLGNGRDNGVTVALATEPSPRIWVDTDNDEDLSDEVVQLPATQITRSTYGWYVEVDVEYSATDGDIRVPHRICLLADKLLGSSGYTFLYGGFCHRSGLLDLDGALIPFALGTLRNDARYDDPRDLIVAVDTNRDGEIDILPGSTDVYTAGGQFQVGSTMFGVETVSPDGRRVIVEQKGTAAPRTAIAEGERAPDFHITTVTGTTVRLSEMRGRPVLLLLTWSPETTSCSACSGAHEEPLRLALVREMAKAYGDRVAVIVVATNPSPPDPGLLALESSGILAAQDALVGELYRRAAGLFVLDRDGVIVAMDVPWSTMQWGVPAGSLDLLSDAEVEDCLYRLLSE